MTDGNVTIETGHNVGEEWHTFTGKIPVGGVPYCGQEVTRATYADLWAYAQNNGLVKTEDDWQWLNTSRKGNVPFYSSGDGSTTFRMPKVVGYIKGAVSQSKAGAYMAEGLPNITGRANSGFLWDSVVASSGALDNITSTFTAQSMAYLQGSDPLREINIDASRSSWIYGNSDHVTPETAVVLFGVYAFGEITNVGALDADTLATGLAKVEANLEANLSGLVKSVNSVNADSKGNVTLGSGDYIVEESINNANWYRKWKSGLVEQMLAVNVAKSSSPKSYNFLVPMSGDYNMVATLEQGGDENSAVNSIYLERNGGSAFYVLIDRYPSTNGAYAWVFVYAAGKGA